jgi:hypothetical protein
LLELTGLANHVAPDLFGVPSAAERHAILVEAYRKQAQRKAYRVRPLGDDSAADISNADYAD